jgi:hypothetical protein
VPPRPVVVWNTDLVRKQLAGEDPAVADEVKAALDRISAAPYDPLDVEVHRSKVPPDPRWERFVARLPHNWWLTYTVAEDVPPIMATVIQYRSMLKREI